MPVSLSPPTQETTKEPNKRTREAENSRVRFAYLTFLFLLKGRRMTSYTRSKKVSGASHPREAQTTPGAKQWDQRGGCQTPPWHCQLELRSGTSSFGLWLLGIKMALCVLCGGCTSQVSFHPMCCDLLTNFPFSCAGKIADGDGIETARKRCQWTIRS